MAIETAANLQRARPADVGPRRGRSGPPPLGLIERPVMASNPPIKVQTAQARTTPTAPPRKPATALSGPADDQDLPSEQARTSTPEAASPGPEPDDLARPPESPDGPDGLMGLTANAVTALLGAPALVRHEALAQIWQYQQASCIFDVFLYEEADGFRVAYFEARDHQARKLSPGPCFSEIRKPPSTPSSPG